MRRCAPVLVVLALVLTGCGGTADPDPVASDSPSVPATPTDPTTDTEPTEEPSSDEPTPEEPPGTTITTGDSPFGPMLFDTNDQAIYIWELEQTSEATCYDDCAVAWPPVLTDGEPVAAGDVRPGLLGTTERRDGSVQVTYNGHPLYFYADEAPGEVKCHNVSTHGGLWWVVQPGGDRAP